MASYRYTDKGQIVNITHNGETKTHNIPLDVYVTIPRGLIHEFSVEELAAMGVPQSVTIEERHNRIAAELSGSIHMGYSFYYINCESNDGSVKRIWIESDAEAEKLRQDLKDDGEDSVDLNDECDYCHGPVGCCGGRCRDRDLYY